ncbi:glycogen/starch synthase [Candidatus Micrarchaeota archaeon]|jgi:glycogen(starch) synthase|nr:glycogen/starch synthase [Candidatus Micrarchaeota archaeon]
MVCDNVDYVFEVSSEVANKVGGIYTVLKTKTTYIHEILGDKYVMVGKLDQKSLAEISEISPPEDIMKAFEVLNKMGIKTAYGKWVGGDNVNVVLIGPKDYMMQTTSYYDKGIEKRDSYLNYAKFKLWEWYQIDSLNSHWDFDENIAWSWCVGIFLEQFYQQTQKKTVAHFHEWISGAGLLYCKKNTPEIGTVFTTHATVLGRTISSTGRDVLGECSGKIKKINVSEAYRYKVEAKHQLEASTASTADVFTTVSETVAMEVEYILGRYPDIITVNGMDFRGSSIEFKPEIAEYVKNELKEFIESYFAPYYELDYSDSVFVFTSGRYEYDNKGYDIFIDSLAELNNRIKGKDNKRNVFAFLFVPSESTGAKLSVIKNYLTTDKIYELLHKQGIEQDQYSNMHEAFRTLPEDKKKLFFSLINNYIKEGSTPPLSAYDLRYDRDKILRELAKKGLMNREEDVVKVIFYPTYLGPSDGLLELPYYDIVSGFDAGIFVSRYEPYGYTPVEAALKLNIAVTSDMSGFGRYMVEKNAVGKGLRVINMYNTPVQESVIQLANIFEEIYKTDKHTLKIWKEEANQLVHDHTNWGKLIRHYVKAYEMAVLN